MALDPIVQALKDRLAQIPGVDVVTDEPPPSLAMERTLILYASPGDIVPIAHAGRGGGGPTWKASDSVMVEYHHKVAADLYGVAEKATRRVLDDVRVAIASVLVSDALRSMIHAIRPISVQDYGDFEVGSDRSFGFRISVDIDHLFDSE